MQGCADVFILYFPNKTRRICSGSFSYNMGPLLGREGVAQNIPSGRDDFLESPVGNAHRDSQNVNLLRLLLESAVQSIDNEDALAFCVLVNIRPTIETV